jgi:osmotically-inducible protein OsmY
MSNEELQGSVKDELFWDPKVDDDAVAVSADDGVVTLRGTVGSLREMREAKNAAGRVYGVTRVENELKVRVLSDDRREDADIRGAVLQALMLDSLVPSTIDARVDDGYVTLTGTAEWNYQRDEAEFVASNVQGVLEVDDEVELTIDPASAGDIEGSIKKAFKRNAKIDAEGVSVETYDGAVVLDGVVSSWAEHDAAVEAAWAAPGVRAVDDRIVVSY